MNREFTREGLYELVWSQPIKVVASDLGISDVALAKQCKKADIPVPGRGYWARKQAGKQTEQVALPPRFPGASDRIGGPVKQGYYFSPKWPDQFTEIPIPPMPTFHEDLPSVRERARKLVGRIQHSQTFEPAHPLVAKLLADDEERRKQFLKYGSSYYSPKYESGTERRRLLILNTLFLAAVRIGCRPSMSTSKYSSDVGGDRDINIRIGETYTYFTLEPVNKKDGNTGARLKLTFGTAQRTATSDKHWTDENGQKLEKRLSEILVELLVEAERQYRQSLINHREWLIERKAEAEAEIIRRAEEAEQKAKELKENEARQRLRQLLREAKAMDRANRIRAYVETASTRSAELPVSPTDFHRWADWAKREADRIDPVRNGMIAKAVMSIPDESAN